MQVYDMANKLAKEIKESSEYERYKRLKSNIESDTSKKEKIEEFEHLRYNIQVRQCKAIMIQNCKNKINCYKKNMQS